MKLIYRGQTFTYDLVKLIDYRISISYRAGTVVYLGNIYNRQQPLFLEIIAGSNATLIYRGHIYNRQLPKYPPYAPPRIINWRWRSSLLQNKSTLSLN